jgi:4,5-dihydroxyphthalate decarboxylase
MPDLTLSFAMTPYDRVMPLITGEVKPVGITLEYLGMPGGVPQVFFDQIKYHRYDLSEFSMSSFMVERAHGYPYRLLPVFHNRNFSYCSIVIRTASGIRQDHPEDLKGKRFALMDYQQTAGLWIRGVLKHEFGVEAEDIDWYQTRGKNYSHTGASGTTLPPGVRLTYVQTDWGTMFYDGTMDAAMGYGPPADSSVDRPMKNIRGNPDFPLLFSDPIAEGARYYKKTGIFPPHHTTVVRQEILDKHPWVAMSLMEAFERAKKIAIQRQREHPPTLMVFGPQYQAQIDELMGPDPFAYGVKANAKAIDFIQQISVEQGLSPKKQALDEIFPESVMIAEERV